MRKSYIGAAMVAFMATSYFAACGDDDSSSSDTKIIEIDSIEDIVDCDETVEGIVLYAIKEDSYFKCVAKKWEVADAEEYKKFVSSSSENSSASKDGKSSSSKTDDKKGKSSSSNSKSSSSTEVVVDEDECKDDAPSVCTNDGKGIGIVKKCINGKFAEISCRSVSCNEEGNDCGECINNVSSCTEDKSFKGTVTKCENGKKIEKSCGAVSCDGNECGLCLNYEVSCVNGTDQKGRIVQCVNGRPGATIQNGNCEEGYSCKRAKVGEDEVKGPQYKFVVCGVCQNGDTKCENDASGGGHMFRCHDGEWHELWNEMGYSYINYDDEGYYVKDDSGYVTTTMVDDPEGYFGKRFTASFYGYVPSKQMAMDYTYGLTGLDSAGRRGRVSCAPDRKHLGECHNTVHWCINETRGKSGYMIVCENGKLADFDGNGDNIACKCKPHANNNGGCSTAHKCYSANNEVTGTAICDWAVNEYEESSSSASP